VDICVCVYVFIQDPDPESDPDPGSDPKLCEKSEPDPDPKKIIPDPQHCLLESLIQNLRKKQAILSTYLLRLPNQRSHVSVRTASLDWLGLTATWVTHTWLPGELST
jgi:hypothetical protein